MIDGGRFTLLARGAYTSNCLTQVQFLVEGSSLGLITASTDGHFTLWHLDPVLEPYYSISASTLRLKQPLETLSISPPNIACENRYQIHSNSIKSMEMARVSAKTLLIVAGGDDNALTLSLLSVDFADADAGSHVCTITIPDAHVASVTTVKIPTGDTDGDIGLLLALGETIVGLEVFTQVIGDLELVRVGVGLLGLAQLVDSLATDLEVLLYPRKIF